MFIYQTNRRYQYYEKVIDRYVNKHLSSRRIAKIVPLSKTTIMRWIANFASDNPKVPIMSKKTVKPKEVFSEPESRLELLQGHLDILLHRVPVEPQFMGNLHTV